MKIALYSFTEFLLDYENIKLNGLLRSVIADRWVFLLLAAVVILAGYFIGGLNFAILISKKRFHDDVRTHGSGNAGFTNMRRIYGKRIARLVFAGDFLKNVVAVALGMMLFGYVTGTLTGLACILGHCYPCYFGFHGGKGVAALAGMVLVLDPVVFLILLAVFALVLLSSHYLSLASVMGALLYPLMLRTVYNYLHMTALPALFRSGVEGVTYFRVPMLNGAVTEIPDAALSAHLSILPTTALLVGVFIAAFVVVRHRSNIKRIMNGEENKFYFKKKESGVVAEAGVVPAPRRSLHSIDGEKDGSDDPSEEE